MDGWTGEVAINTIKNSLTKINNSYKELDRNATSMEKEALEFFQSLLDQIPNAISGPLIPKTPKLPKKRDIKRIQTIPEDDVVDNEANDENNIVEDVTVGEKTYDEVPVHRTRRAASQKAAESIKVQQTTGVGAKLRRPSTNDEATAGTSNLKAVPTSTRPSRAKRTKSVAESSDEDEIRRPAKYIRIKQNSVEKHESDESIVLKVQTDDEIEEPQITLTNESTVTNSKKRGSRNKRQREKSSGTLSREDSHSTGKIWQQPLAKKANVVDETMESDMTVEASLYEDAIGKSIPMNSTMNPNTSVTFDRKMMNVTVVLEAMKFPMKINETVTINKGKSNESSEGNATLVNEATPQMEQQRVVPGSPRATTSILQSKIKMQNKMKELKKTLANPEFDALITEDESSPEKMENKKMKITSSSKNVKEAKRLTRSSTISDEDVFEVTPSPPPKTVLRDVNGLKALKNTYKPNALFSPYSKESVKKRVEAFEQAGLNSPKTVEIDAPARQTRTKTRAMAAASADTNYTQTGQTVAQKAARKSLAKAKEFAKMKERKENEESKENNVNSAQKPSRLMVANEKLAQKQQLRTTPVSKSRIQMPMSLNRIQHTPASSQLVNQKTALTASRANMLTTVDSFIQPPKTLTKSNSSDNLAERRKKVNDEDAKRKREETLKAMSEEKRRKREERELKNKLAKEAKEKLDMEKRLKQEREREEKAKTALLLQEKAREDAERKKLLQLQRAQEKEERRRQEEQMKLLRLQEQEEAERQLAEQKRREQEAERRKIAEARAQQAAAAEAARIKAHYIAKAQKANKQQDPTSYVLDSEPDDDESDDESKPKHLIPYWALPNVRVAQLKIQSYIPTSVVLEFFGTKRCTPDLTDLFKGIKKERLQRTSSAIWKTPPRYSMMMNDMNDQ